MNAERETKEKKQNYKTSLEEEKEEEDDDDDDGVYYFKLLFTTINQQCGYFWGAGFFNSLIVLQLNQCCAPLSLSLINVFQSR
jgi:hypothetical protein